MGKMTIPEIRKELRAIANELCSGEIDPNHAGRLIHELVDEMRRKSPALGERVHRRCTDEVVEQIVSLRHSFATREQLGAHLDVDSGRVTEVLNIADAYAPGMAAEDIPVREPRSKRAQVMRVIFRRHPDGTAIER